MMTARTNFQRVRLALGVLCLSAMTGSAYADAGTGEIKAHVRKNISEAADLDARWSLLRLGSQGSMLTGTADAAITCAHAGSKTEGWLAICRSSENGYHVFFEFMPTDKIAGQLKKATGRSWLLDLLLAVEKKDDKGDMKKATTNLRINVSPEGLQEESSTVRLYTVAQSTESTTDGDNTEKDVLDAKDMAERIKSQCAGTNPRISSVKLCTDGTCADAKAKVWLRKSPLSLEGAQPVLETLLSQE